VASKRVVMRGLRAGIEPPEDTGWSAGAEAGRT
jgi:hypothetical protein